jgi:flagellar basal-body rod protein FlgG
MLEGMYSAAAGMAAQQHRLDALSNDIANVDTTGYKRLRVAFRDLLYTPEGLATQGITEGAGASAATIGRSGVQGAARRTDRSLDVAILGQGWLQMRRADGTPILTRDGNLTFDSQGRLSSQRGDIVQPPITLPADGDVDLVQITPDGRVTLRGTELGRLQVVTVPSPEGLQDLGDNGFALTAASGAVRPAPATTVLEQGALEGSNVDMGDAMTEMLESQRAYEMASKAIQAQDKAAEIANGIRR